MLKMTLFTSNQVGNSKNGLFPTKQVVTDK